MATEEPAIRPEASTSVDAFSISRRVGGRRVGGAPRIPLTLWALPVTGLTALVIYAAAAGSWSIAGVALMAGAASFIAGSFLGFLFSIPRTLTSERSPLTQVGEQERRLEYEPNTNLEQISDWLTKILVGVGLVQLGQLRDSIRDLVDFLAPGLGDDRTARAFALVLLVYFAVSGFLTSYLFTRLWLQGAIAQAERSLVDVVEAVAERQFRRQADIDATALGLVTRQLETRESVDSDELAAAVAGASQPVKVQIFYQAHRLRSANWATNKELMERTIPVFGALAKADEDRQYHRHFGELGFALKDKPQPDWAAAEEALTTAIEIRDRFGEDGFRVYEYVRADCRIHLDPAFESAQPSDDARRNEILDDLRAAATERFWRGRLARETSFTRWLAANDLTVDDLGPGG